jgi:hypothetical protein
MSQYSGPQTQQKYEHAATDSGKTGTVDSEPINPNYFNGRSQESHNPKRGAFTAGSSPKIGSKAGGSHVNPGHE